MHRTIRRTDENYSREDATTEAARAEERRERRATYAKGLNLAAACLVIMKLP